MTGPVTGIRRRRGVAGRRETPHLPLDRDFYGQTLIIQLSYLLFLSRISRCVATSVISATSEIILSLNVYREQFAFVQSVSRLSTFTPYRS